MSGPSEKDIVTNDETGKHELDPEKASGPKMQKLAGEITYEDESDPSLRQHNPLAQKLRSRHMQKIAIGMSLGPQHHLNLQRLFIPCSGGSIGAGLFVGSGSALRSGGFGLKERT